MKPRQNLSNHTANCLVITHLPRHRVLSAKTAHPPPGNRASTARQSHICCPAIAHPPPGNRTTDRGEYAPIILRLRANLSGIVCKNCPATIDSLRPGRRRLTTPFRSSSMTRDRVRYRSAMTVRYHPPRALPSAAGASAIRWLCVLCLPATSRVNRWARGNGARKLSDQSTVLVQEVKTV